MGGRAVECTALEMRRTRKGTGSSNLPPSAIYLAYGIEKIYQTARWGLPTPNSTHKLKLDLGGR